MGEERKRSPLESELDRALTPQGGRRPLSWLAVIIALVAGLLLPMLAFAPPPSVAALFAQLGLVAEPVNRAPDLKMQPTPWYGALPASATGVRTVAALDRVWDAGPLSTAHQPWALDCKACHSEPFARVKDADCLTCHSTLAQHAPDDVSSMRAQRCASCHREHHGRFGLDQQNRQQTAAECSTCHADIKKTAPKSELRNVRDFADEHPQFAVRIATSAKADAFKRVVLPEHGHLEEGTALKFPHDVHLAKKGIAGPRGDKVMECKDCHVPDSTRTSFKPVTMSEHCQSCHELRFEPALSGRQVPHGSVDEVLNTLAEFYGFLKVEPHAAPVPPEVGYRARPGKPDKPAEVKRTAPYAGAEAAARELFEKTSCVVCHDVQRKAGGGAPNTPGARLPSWTIGAVTPAHAWMPQARFNHDSHTMTECKTCHAAERSKKATEVLMPGIKVCRDCHVGATAVADKVRSDCGLCHGFHPKSPAHAAPVKTATAGAPR